MALSNWDTLAFNDAGEACDGTFTHPETGASIEIYKNWLYIHHPKAWREKEGYEKPVIAQISEGDIQLAGFNIQAVRGPQAGVFVFATYTEVRETPPEKEGEESEVEFIPHVMAGIGCCAYDDNSDRVLKAAGFKRRPRNEFDVSYLYTGDDGDYYCLNIYSEKAKRRRREIRIPMKGNEHLDSQCVGVLPETYQEFLTWVEKQIDDDRRLIPWLEKIKAAKPLRFNQGDAFFAGADATMTEVGQVQEPVIIGMMGLLKEAAKPDFTPNETCAGCVSGHEWEQDKETGTWTCWKWPPAYDLADPVPDEVKVGCDVTCKEPE